MMADKFSLIRNFTIISHVDHGKSTLADRFLELTETIPKEKIGEQYLDKMSLEKERGITIKMHPCRMVWQAPNMEGKQEFVLNLIDTPGHVDFSYEVSRALAAVEGAVLLVDAVKGIQAQTVANLELAKDENLTIVPAINKIDLPQAKEEETKEELAKILSISEDEILSISAKNGIGIEKLLSVIIKKVPPPTANLDSPLKALIFDSKYDLFQGVVAYIRVFEGEIRKGDKIYFLRKKIEEEVKEVGYFSPEFIQKEKLSAGEIGYIKTGVKEPEKIRVGDTIIKSGIENESSGREFPAGKKSEKSKVADVKPLSGYNEPKPMIFTSIFPKEPSNFENLKKGIEELHLSDPSFTFEQERKEVLGIGFRCGFLGILHFEIVLERLKSEFSLFLLVARPTVLYKIIGKDNAEHLIYSPEDWLEATEVKEIKEPWIEAEIIASQKYFNNIFQLLSLFKANFLSSESLGKDKIKIYIEMPFRKLIENFYDKLKTVSQGFASMSFKIGEMRAADLVKLDILVLRKKETTLSKIVGRSEAEREAREIVKKLKETFPSQLFSVPIQAAIGGKIIARETVKAKRKDVTAPLYGGDVTRKRKLLEKQKKGKKKMEKEGKINIPNEVIIGLLKE